MATEQLLLKIVFIGSGSVGKTCIVRRYAEGKFTRNYLPTLGVDISTRKTTLTARVGTFSIKTILTDTAGQEFFRKLRPSYYRGANACVSIFSLVDRDSFSSIPRWFKEFNRYKDNKDAIIVLVGNKMDLQEERNISNDEIEKFCTENGYEYFETSAATGYGIDIMMNHVIRKVLEKKLKLEKHPISFEILSEINEEQKTYLNGLKNCSNWDTVRCREFLADLVQYLNEVSISEDHQMSSFLNEISEHIMYLPQKTQSSLIKAICYVVLAKSTILAALTKKIEGSLEVYLDLYIDGLNYYATTLSFFDFDLHENAYWLNLILHDLFMFYSRMIAEPIDINRVRYVLDDYPGITRIGLEYGDKIFLFFNQCLTVRSSRSLSDYKHLKSTLERINSMFHKDNPHLQLANETYEVVMRHLPPIFIVEKKIYPNPPNYGETALVLIKMSNILEEKIPFRLDLKLSSTKEITKQTLSLEPLEIKEIAIPLDRIESSTLYIRIEILLKKGGKFKALYHDSMQVNVGGGQQLIINIQIPGMQEKLKKNKKLKMYLFFFNNDSKSVQTQVIADRSWDSEKIHFPLKEIQSRQLENIELDLDLENLTGEQSISFKFLDKDNCEIPNSTYVVEFAIEQSKSGKILRYLKGAGKVVVEAGKVIT